MKYGYARISTDKNQKNDTQVDQLKRYGVDKIISETVIGVAKVKKLNKLIETTLKEGDSLVVARMDRLGRKTIQLLQLMEELEERNISLVFLDYNVDTSTAAGKMFIRNLASFAEFERDLIKEKTRAGIELAKQKGRYKGKQTKFKLNNDDVQRALEDYDSGKYTVKHICKLYKLSRATFYRRLKERDERNGTTE